MVGRKFLYKEFRSFGLPKNSDRSSPLVQKSSGVILSRRSALPGRCGGLLPRPAPLGSLRWSLGCSRSSSSGYNPGPWAHGESRSTSSPSNHLHHRSSRIKNWWLYFLDPPLSVSRPKSELLGGSGTQHGYLRNIPQIVVGIPLPLKVYSST